MDPSLYRMITSGDVATLKQRITSDDDLLHQTTYQKNTTLHIAVLFRVSGCVEEICKRRPLLLMQPNSKGDIPLHIAARLGSSNIVAYLIHRAKFLHYEDVVTGVGGEVLVGHIEGSTTTVLQQMVRMKNEENDTALHEAVRYEWLDVIKLLLKADPTFEYSDNNNGETPLYLAAEKGLYNVVDQILETCSSAAHGGPSGRTALHAAVLSGSSGIVKLLLDKKKSTIIKEVDENGSSALHYSAYFAMVEVAVQLLEFDPSIANLRNKDGKTALHIAASSRMTRRLAFHYHIHKIDFRTTVFGNYYAEYQVLNSSKKKSLLGKAMRNVQLIKMLLEYMFVGRRGNTESAAISQLIEAVNWHCPGCWELVDNKGRNFLHVAAENGQSAVIKYVVNESKITESLINEKDNNGNTPLHLVLNSRSRKCVEIICTYPGVNKKAINKDNHTAFDIVLQKMQDNQHGLYEEFLQMAYEYLFEGGSVCHLERRLMKGGEEAVLERDRSTKGKREEKEGYEADKRKVEIMRENASQTHMLVATLIATVTFASSFTLPRGYISDGPNQGMATLINRPAFTAFQVSNTIAMFFSASVLFVHFWPKTVSNDEVRMRQRKIVISLTCTVCAVIAMMVAFATGTYTVLRPSSKLAISLCVLSCSFMPFSLLLIAWIKW